MRFWDASGPAVEAADAEPWDMTWAAAMRPFGTRSLVGLMLGGAVLYGASGTSGIGLALSAGSEMNHPGQALAFHCTATSLALSMLVILLVLSPHQIRRTAPVLTIVLLASAPMLVTWGLASGGPGFAIVAMAYIEAPLFAFYMLRRRWAVAHAAVVVACFGAVVAFQEGWNEPFWTWLFLAANVIGTGVVVGQLAARADALAASEHEARVELADLNHTLADRVRTQVTEIERLGRLRRFLSTQVADVVLAGGTAELSKPHRARIAVVFCDLRGFTAFTNGAEPEEVVGVLDEYYGTVGGLLQCYGATIGDYAGDGVMAYFGDPVPRADSARTAVAMACELRDLMAGVVGEWKRRGYELDYGVGLAYGYATLGVVGFDGRHDYKPVGGVVNLAARLCDRAGAGEVLLDHATYAETAERFPSRPFADLDLKGYPARTRAYALG